MKWLNLLFVIVLLCKTINADNGEEKTVRRNRQGLSERRRFWKVRVGEHYKGVRAANARLVGTDIDITKPIDVLQRYIETVSGYTNSKSTILASSATDIEASLSRCDKLTQSGLNIIVEYNKVYPDLIEDFKDIAEKLSVYNEKLIREFIEAVSEFRKAFLNYMKDVLKEGSKKEIDFKPALKKYQKLTTIVGEASNNTAGTQEELETVLVLDLLYLYLGNGIQGITSCSLQVLYNDAYQRRQKYRVQDGIRFYLLSLDDSLNQILKAVKDVASPVKEVLPVVSNIIKKLNAVFNKILEPAHKSTVRKST